MVAHSEILLSKCAQFREQGEFIDVRLKVGEDVFPAHRIVLAANSNYFHAMFAHGMKESNQEVIELKDENISAAALKIVMDSIYSGELHVDDGNVFEVLLAADHLQVLSVVQQCCNYLLREFVQVRFDVQTYCHICTIADQHCLTDLKEATQRTMAAMYREICESEKFLSHMEADHLSSLLSRDDLIAPSETFVFKSVMQWIRYKKEERMAVAGKIVGAVRLGLVDIKDVNEELNTEEMQRVPEIQAIFSQALLHNQMPSHTSKFAVENAKPRSTSLTLVAVSSPHFDPSYFSHIFFPEMKYFDSGIKTWKPLLSMASVRFGFMGRFLCAEYVGDYLYVAIKTGLRSGSIYRYHIVNNVWETLPHFQSGELEDHQIINCFCSMNDYIYAMSDTNQLQRYSLAQNKWQSGYKLYSKHNLSHVSAVVMKSKIYVLHGCSKEKRRGFKAKAAVVHCFDPQKNEWEQRTSTQHPHFGSTLLVDNNTLYVIGGKLAVKRCGKDMIPDGDPAPVEVYDAVNNSWSVVKQNNIPPNKLGAVEINGKVFFVINKFPVDSGIRIPPGEVYHISLHEWEGHYGKAAINRISNYDVLCYLPVKNTASR